MCWYHVTFDLDLDLDLEHIVDVRSPGDYRVQFGGDRTICLVEEAVCAKNLQTDRRTTDAVPLH